MLIKSVPNMGVGWHWHMVGRRKIHWNFMLYIVFKVSPVITKKAYKIKGIKGSA